MSQKELAELAGCSPSTINRIERSGRGVSRDLVERIAVALDAAAVQRVELLQAAGLVDDETAGFLESPPLTRLSRLLSLPEMRPGDRALLVRYIDLALAHADALGYIVPPSWPGTEEVTSTRPGTSWIDPAPE